MIKLNSLPYSWCCDMDRYGAFVFVQSLHCAILDSFDLFFAGRKAMFSPWNPDCCIHDGFCDDSWCVPVLRAAKLSGSPPKELCRSILSEFVWFNYHSSLVRPACLVEARAAKKIRTSLAMQRHEQVRELHCQWRMWRKTVDVRWYEGKWHRTCMDRWRWVFIVKPHRCLWSLHNYDHHTCSCRFA